MTTSVRLRMKMGNTIIITKMMYWHNLAMSMAIGIDVGLVVALIIYSF